TITHTPVNSSNTPATVTYTITPSVGSCAGVPVNYVVTVNPIPDANATLLHSICSGETTNISITNPNAVTGTTYTWTISGATNITGASAGSGSVISQMLTSTDGVNAATVTYNVTPSANGCSGAPIAIVVDVTPKPVITNTPTSFIQEICSNTPLNFIPTASIGGTVFNWTSTVIGTLTGVSASGIGAITDTPINATNTDAVIIYTITPGVGSCNGTPVNLVVTVRAVPEATAANQTICSGESTAIDIINSNAVAGTTFTWTAVSSNVTGASNGSGNKISQ